MQTKSKIKQHTLADKILVISCLATVLGLVGCQQESTAEKAEQKIDQAAEKAEQKIDEATEKAEIKIEAAKESLDEKTEAAKEAVKESSDASKGALESAGQKLDQATENAEQKIEGAKESVVEHAQIAAEYIDDSVITSAVKAAISGDSSFKASDIEVTTAQGVVILKGTVDSELLIERARSVASSQKNVKSVQNDLLVSPVSAAE
ncbi:BON domain-containing protein [Methylicorpusculum sp.]|uniref:BON domain-containing protein n=1 Tax=Methylicorpusculum sp. TaxID=2713644 RepID=UPI002719ACC1|nr:BON domain-containing protein [Methylicorpusculum sp.]MDO8843088.1 BON domain-containing protein [Methylicorpusculum sp.]MDP2180788.1 BON domain-containing protein [Methylicorpusculum sp.]MDP3527899.1 BON domain-containing protein [Methylicorpusculum sp.]MDZ4153084.1 BON domain-containing protein [Methylicorpusculum sp.]